MTTQSWIASAWQDMRYAVRSLARRPWRFAAAVGLLGLAIGISAAMFTVLDALILRPVPFKDPDQLARLYMSNGPGGVSPALFREWKASPLFLGVESADWSSAVVTTDAGDVTRGHARVTPGIFDLLGGVTPVRGRLFDATDGTPGATDRVLISEDVWRTLYSADAEIVGRRITMNDESLIVVGVLPAEFRFPRWNTVIWRADRSAARGDVFVRLAPGVPKADAERAATNIARVVNPADTRRTARAEPLAEAQLDDYYQRAVPLLSGGIVLLFIVLCANVSSLLLAGLAARGREFGTRAALGAPRARLVRLALFESVFTGIGGLMAGVVLAWQLVSIARTVLPQAALLRSLNPLNLDARALAVTSVAAFLATMVAGVLPAFIGTRADVSRLLQWGSRGSTESGRARYATRALLVAQIALSCTLLIGATLLVRSFVTLVTEDRGLDARNVLVADFELPSAASAPDESAVIARTLEETARALPGIRQTSWGYGMPPYGGVQHEGEWASDVPGQAPVKMNVYQFIVDDNFFQMYGVPILRGRAVLPSDERGAVLVSERFARAVWPGLDAVGRRFAFRGNSALVVGVVRDVHFPSLDRKRDAPQFYTPFRGVGVRGMLSLRCDGTCPEPASVRRKLAAVSAKVNVLSVSLAETTYRNEFARPRAAAALAFAFAVTALIAAAAGLFTLLSHTAAQRRREFGIRAALGASPANVRRLVWQEGLTVTLAGIGLGTLAGLSLSRVLQSLLLDVRMTDPATCAIVAGVLTATIAAASWPPARSAAKASPVVLLREE